MRPHDERLGMAILSGMSQEVRSALQQGASPDAVYLDKPVLCLAAADDSMFTASKLLIEHGANVNGSTADGETPLIVAAYAAPRTAKMLIAVNADVRASDAEGFTALMAAVKAGHADIARELIHAGADVNQSDSAGRTPLHWVSTEGDFTGAAEILIEAGADIDAMALNGMSPMDYASRLLRRQVLTVLQRAAAARSE